MSVTVANLITNTDTYFGDSSTDRVSQAERFQALTEATVWLLEELGNDHAIKTYTLDYLDTVNYYKVTAGLVDLLASADLRRGVGTNYMTARPTSSKEMAEAIARNSDVFAWAIERRDDDTYLVVNLDVSDVNKQANIVENFDSVTSWLTDGDATNITLDSYEKQQGAGSLNFDVDVSVSGSNYAAVYRDDLPEMDLSAYVDTGSLIFDVYLPDVTEITSVTLYWGSSVANYYSATVTTDIDGAAFQDGWNTIKIDWSSATMTGTPDTTAMNYIKYQVNYGAGQVDDTDFRIDYLRIAKPERLTYHYVSWDVGKTNAGTEISAYTATNDIPFFSGKYDQYKYAVAHKAASILFYAVRLREEAQAEEREAVNALTRQKDIFPQSKAPETQSFKVAGINFNRRRR
jgi:hypothetical protein